MLIPGSNKKIIGIKIVLSKLTQQYNKDDFFPSVNFKHEGVFQTLTRIATFQREAPKIHVVSWGHLKFQSNDPTL